MESRKVFKFQSGEEKLEVVILEVVDPQYGLFTWPSALVLAQFVWHKRNTIKNKEIIEIGTGTALPGVVAGLCGASITLTDGEDYLNCLENCTKTCKANGLTNFHVTGVTWGIISKALLNFKKFDIILGSDCFYDPINFDDILATVSFLLERNPRGQFWVSYQERSANWSIELLLKTWNLKCQCIPLPTFGADYDLIGGVGPTTNHTIQLLVITKLT